MEKYRQTNNLLHIFLLTFFVFTSLFSITGIVYSLITVGVGSSLFLLCSAGFITSVISSTYNANVIYNNITHRRSGKTLQKEAAYSTKKKLVDLKNHSPSLIDFSGSEETLIPKVTQNVKQNNKPNLTLNNEKQHISRQHLISPCTPQTQGTSFAAPNSLKSNIVNQQSNSISNLSPSSMPEINTTDRSKPLPQSQDKSNFIPIPPPLPQDPSLRLALSTQKIKTKADNRKDQSPNTTVPVLPPASPFGSKGSEVLQQSSEPKLDDSDSKVKDVKGDVQSDSVKSQDTDNNQNKSSMPAPSSMPKTTNVQPDIILISSSVSENNLSVDNSKSIAQSQDTDNNQIMSSTSLPSMFVDDLNIFQNDEPKEDPSTIAFIPPSKSEEGTDTCPQSPKSKPNNLNPQLPNASDNQSKSTPPPMPENNLSANNSEAKDLRIHILDDIKTKRYELKKVPNKTDQLPDENKDNSSDDLQKNFFQLIREKGNEEKRIERRKRVATPESDHDNDWDSDDNCSISEAEHKEDTKDPLGNIDSGISDSASSPKKTDNNDIKKSPDGLLSPCSFLGSTENNLSYHRANLATR